MPIHPIYEDFFRFLQVLDSAREDPWEAYQKFYFHPHREFFAAYWKTYFPQMDLVSLQDRVRQVRRGHYATLEHLLEQSNPEPIVQRGLKRCRARMPECSEPDVYLMVGFFSADGFTLKVMDRPVIGIGLERYRNFVLLDIILAHEYCHCARHLALGSFSASDPRSLGQKLLDEGLCTVFSRQVYPRRKLADHLLISTRRLDWCQRNEALLESMAGRELNSSRLVPVFFGWGQPDEGVPARTGMYLGYRLVERALAEMGPEAFHKLLAMQDIAAVWPAERGANDNPNR
jgi:hypothetical protein